MKSDEIRKTTEELEELLKEYEEGALNEYYDLDQVNASEEDYDPEEAEPEEYGPEGEAGPEEYEPEGEAGPGETGPEE